MIILRRSPFANRLAFLRQAAGLFVFSTCDTSENWHPSPLMRRSVATSYGFQRPFLVGSGCPQALQSHETIMYHYQIVTWWACFVCQMGFIKVKTSRETGDESLSEAILVYAILSHPPPQARICDTFTVTGYRAVRRESRSTIRAFVPGSPYLLHLSHYP